MSDPERWLHSKDAPAGMSEMLQTAQERGPSVAERAALATKIGLSTSGAWLVTSLKALTIGLAVGGSWMIASGGNAPAFNKSETSQAADATTQKTTPPPADTSAKDISPSLPQPAAEAPPAAAPPPTTMGQDMELKKPQLPSEASLIRGARASLKKDPQRSLALLKRHKRLYPQGVLTEEREVLRIRALKSAGKTQAAQKQKREFMDAHPDSPHHLP